MDKAVWASRSLRSGQATPRPRPTRSGAAGSVRQSLSYPPSQTRRLFVHFGVLDARTACAILAARGFERSLSVGACCPACSRRRNGGDGMKSEVRDEPMADAVCRSGRFYRLHGPVCLRSTVLGGRCTSHSGNRRSRAPAEGCRFRDEVSRAQRAGRSVTRTEGPWLRPTWNMTEAAAAGSRGENRMPSRADTRCL